MATTDTCCSIVPYFQIADEHLPAFKILVEKFVAQTALETGCLYYGFCFNGNQAHCREGYDNAESLLAHLDNVGSILEQALKISELTRLEIHGPAAELAKLAAPLAHLSPAYFVLEYGFRR